MSNNTKCSLIKNVIGICFELAISQTNQQRYSFYDKAIHRVYFKDHFDVSVLKVAFNDSWSATFKLTEYFWQICLHVTAQKIFRLLWFIHMAGFDTAMIFKRFQMLQSYTYRKISFMI